ncbi:TolC family protein [uncultured Pseudomonas sp.]|uniref:TolC family protein n=1 Tax=uncultured Pseudomonas sp. TaxID=114707 RepID=UPI0025904006|nr:TolC family protein [uncultured Pseudomonas sp.]
MNSSLLTFRKMTFISIGLACAYVNFSGVVLAQENKQLRLDDRQIAALIHRFPSSATVPASPTTGHILATTPAVKRQDLAINPTISTLQGPTLRSVAVGSELPVNRELRSLMRDFVAKALRHSPEVRVSIANENVAAYEIDEVKGRRWPQVRLGMNSALTKNDSGSSNSNRTAGTLSVITNVWDWGKNARDTGAATASLEVKKQNSQAERERVAFNTTSELINLLRAIRSSEVAEDYVRQMSDRVDMLSKITQNDKGRASELVQARARLLSAQASREQIIGQQHISQIRLHRILGEEVPEVSGALLVLSRPMIDQTAALSSLDVHPLLLQLKARADVEGERQKALKAQGLPGLNLVVRKEQRDSMGSHARGPNDWYAGVDVQWDIFSGGSNTAAQKAAGERKTSALEEYQKTEQDLRLEIMRSTQNRANALQQARNYQQLAIETDRVRKMYYEQWYHLGKRTLLDVLVAENEHFNSQLQAIGAISDSLINDLSILSSSAQLLSHLSVGE